MLKRNQEEIRRRTGRGIEITMVADLDVARAKMEDMNTNDEEMACRILTGTARQMGLEIVD